MLRLGFSLEIAIGITWRYKPRSLWQNGFKVKPPGCMATYTQCSKSRSMVGTLTSNEYTTLVLRDAFLEGVILTGDLDSTFNNL
jgi:hypothetical protein